MKQISNKEYERYQQYQKDVLHAASITVELAEDYTLPENWETISDFHVEVTRKMTDIIFKPNEAEIAKIVSGS